jgi:hypothetical protein
MTVQYVCTVQSSWQRASISKYVPVGKKHFCKFRSIQFFFAVQKEQIIYLRQGNSQSHKESMEGTGKFVTCK